MSGLPPPRPPTISAAPLIQSPALSLRSTRSRVKPATSVTLSSARLANKMAAGLTLRRTRSINSRMPPASTPGVSATMTMAEPILWASSINDSADTPPAFGPAASCFFRSRTSFAKAATRCGTSLGGTRSAAAVSASDA